MKGKYFQSLIGLALAPAAWGVARAFHAEISKIGLASGSLRTLERGVLAYLFLHVFLIRPVYLYVLSHELVHVFATWLCGGRVVAFKVTPSGGNVVTNKTNFFIELSPYFVPLYTLLIGPFFSALRAFGVSIPYQGMAFTFMVGVTLAFHFVMTAEALRIEQTDIIKSGAIFSLVIIFMGNLILTTGLFSTFMRNVSFGNFLSSSWVNAQAHYGTMWNRLQGFFGFLGF